MHQRYYEQLQEAGGQSSHMRTAHRVKAGTGNLGACHKNFTFSEKVMQRTWKMVKRGNEPYRFEMITSVNFKICDISGVSFDSFQTVPDGQSLQNRLCQLFENIILTQIIV